MSTIESLILTANKLVATAPVLSMAFGVWSGAVLTFFTTKLPSLLHERISSFVMTSVTVLQCDQDFRALAAWIERKGYSRRFRTLRAIGGELSAGYGTHFFIYKRRLFWISRARIEGKGDRTTEEITLAYFGRDQGILRRVVSEALADFQRPTAPVVYTYPGYWEELQTLQRRPLGSIVMSKSNRERLVSHLRQFLASEQWYREHGIPFRTGLCLHGPPGTGKTSLVKAICSDFNLDLYVLDLGAGSGNDRTLREAVSGLDGKGVLLLEDIDTVNVSADRETSEKPAPATLVGATLGGLLNAIDGIADSDGRIVIMTTNHLSVLDPALIRPGRVDLILELGYMTTEVFEEAFKRFYPGFALPSNVAWKEAITPAAFQAFVLASRSDPFAVLRQCSASCLSVGSAAAEPVSS